MLGYWSSQLLERCLYLGLSLRGAPVFQSRQFSLVRPGYRRVGLASSTYDRVRDSTWDYVGERGVTAAGDYMGVRKVQSDLLKFSPAVLGHAGWVQVRGGVV